MGHSKVAPPHEILSHPLAWKRSAPFASSALMTSLPCETAKVENRGKRRWDSGAEIRKSLSDEVQRERQKKEGGAARARM